MSVAFVTGLSRQLASSSGQLLSFGHQLRRIIHDFRPHIVHSNGIKMHILAAMTPFGPPLIWHVHDFLGARPITKWLARLLAPRVDLAIAISNSVRQDFLSIAPSVKTRTIHNAIDVAIFHPNGPNIDLDSFAGPDFEGAPGLRRIGLLATYARWKGHDTFLRAAAKLVGEGQSNLRFYIIGGPLYATAQSQFSRAELQGLVSDRLRKYVVFVPFQKLAADVLRSLDIVVHASSRAEPFGLTIVEAMASGKPTIVSRAGGAAEVFIEGENALGFEPGDDDDLARCIRRLAGDAGLCGHLGTGARAHAVARFNRDRLGPQLLGAYQEVLRARG
jgi:glycosyltransferase involved in cell wall biosynthesis